MCWCKQIYSISRLLKKVGSNQVPNATPLFETLVASHCVGESSKYFTSIPSVDRLRRRRPINSLLQSRPFTVVPLLQGSSNQSQACVTKVSSRMWGRGLVISVTQAGAQQEAPGEQHHLLYPLVFHFRPVSTHQWWLYCILHPQEQIPKHQHLCSCRQPAQIIVLNTT